MTTYLPRTSWTSAKNGRAGRPLNPNKVTAMTVHYPADGNVTLARLTQAETAARLRGYRAHHINHNGWADIGYNYAIDGAGRVWDLTGDNIGAHAGDAGNPTSLGVLFLVGDAETPTVAAIAAFNDLRKKKLQTFTRATKVQGHQQVPGNSTSCPGGPLMALIRSGALTDTAPAPADDTAARMSVMTYNLAAKAKKWQRDTFNSRLPIAVKLVAAADPTVLCLQEAGSIGYVKKIDAALKPLGLIRAPGNGAPLYNRWRYIYTNPDLVTVKASDVMTINTLGTKHAATATLADRATGKQILVTSAHLTAGGASTDKDRITQAGHLIRKSNNRAKGRMPIIHAGDFNSLGLVGSQVMAPAELKDSKHIADKVISGEYDTFNAREHVARKHGGDLDHIYVSTGVDVLRWEQYGYIYNDRYTFHPSDHNPILAEFRY